MLLSIILLLIFVACIGFLSTEGLWGNAIRLINVVTAALLAMNFFEPLAGFLEDLMPSFTYFWDFIALWGLFTLFLVIFRVLTDFASRVNVRFLKIVDRIGGGLFAAWVGWVMVCFTLMSLHTAPLAHDFLGFQPQSHYLLGLAPDRRWLGLTQRMSQGTFCRWASAAAVKQEKYVFDPDGEFMPKYNSRRTQLEEHAVKTDSFRVVR